MKGLSSLLFPIFLLAASLQAQALEFDEIKEFGEVFKVSAEARNRQQVDVSWEIASGYYLYNNKFLKFKTETSGVTLGAPVIPEGERKFDELLG